MKKEKGFTLIELLVVIAIIGILAILIFVAMGRAQAGARNSQRKAVCHDVATAQAMYYDAHKTYGSWAQLRSGYISQLPSVCATAVTTCTTAEATSTWTAAVTLPTGNFQCQTNLENGGNFTCNKDGCH